MPIESTTATLSAHFSEFLEFPFALHHILICLSHVIPIEVLDVYPPIKPIYLIPIPLRVIPSGCIV